MNEYMIKKHSGVCTAAARASATPNEFRGHADGQHRVPTWHQIFSAS